MHAHTYCPLLVKRWSTIICSKKNKHWQLMFSSGEYYSKENNFSVCKIETMSSDIPPP